mmetsp:Transcript_16056/g.55882  ORF Transcript_16056/g.55882 Transcript_16056/m.55882 type:complete len:285 (-) Transcript_16056:559-1413(-)
MMPRPSEDRAVEATQGAVRRDQVQVPAQEPELVRGEDEGVLAGSPQQQAVNTVDLLDLAEVSQEHVEDLPHHLVVLVVAGAHLQVQGPHVRGQAQRVQIRDVDAAAHGVVLGADVQHPDAGARERAGGAAALREGIAREGAVVDAAVLEGVPPLALLQVFHPPTVVHRPVGVAEGAFAMPHTATPLSRVVVVHLLRGHVASSLIRCKPRRRGGLPSVRAPALWVVVLPMALVVLGDASIAPCHLALAGHAPEAPLAFVDVAAGPDLHAVPVLATVAPLPFVVSI